VGRMKWRCAYLKSEAIVYSLRNGHTHVFACAGSSGHLVTIVQLCAHNCYWLRSTGRARGQARGKP
jgi:hypothetical protein